MKKGDKIVLSGEKRKKELFEAYQYASYAGERFNGFLYI